MGSSENSLAITHTMSLARVAHAEVRRLYLEAGRSWVKFGVAISRFHAAKTYQEMGSESFKQYLEDFHFGKSQVYSAMKLVRKLSERLALDDIEPMTQANAKALVRLPVSKWGDPEVIRAAQTLTEQEFIDCVKTKDDKAWQGDEHMHRMVWLLPESAYQVITETLKLAMRLEESDNRNVGLERIFGDFRTGNQ